METEVKQNDETTTALSSTSCTSSVGCAAITQHHQDGIPQPNRQSTMTTLPQPNVFNNNKLQSVPTTIHDMSVLVTGTDNTGSNYKHMEISMVREYMQLMQSEKALEDILRCAAAVAHTAALNVAALTEWKIRLQLYRNRKAGAGTNRTMSLFVDSHGLPAPSNPDAVQKAELRNQLPHYRKKYEWNVQAWTDTEKDRLEEAVEERLKQDLCVLTVEENVLKNHNIDANDAMTAAYSATSPMSLQETLHLLETALQSKAVRSAAVHDDDRSDDDTDKSTGDTDEDGDFFRFSINAYWISFWDNIATSLAGRVDKTGKDCQIQWMHHHDPTVNR
eukprot:Lankesteria_metandrocarpae@DN7935_c0_g1_i1.p1